MEILYPIFRIWKETNTSLNEIMNEWSYEQVMQANAFLDMVSSNELAVSTYDLIELEKSTKRGK